jgi:hypothetical protein
MKLMKAVACLSFLPTFLVCASVAYADTVVIGYPLDYTTTSALFPGLGEEPVVDVVPRLGQTFTVPAGHPYLTTFSFWLSDSPFFEPQPTTFGAVLMAYGPDRPVGPVIYHSINHSTAGLAHAERRRFDFNVGAMLDPLESYVFFLDVVPYLDGVPSVALFASEGADVYSGGELVHSDIATDLAHVSDNPWQPSGAGWEVIFRAEFNVPEPSNIALLVVASVPMLLRYRRCNRLNLFGAPLNDAD